MNFLKDPKWGFEIKSYFQFTLFASIARLISIFLFPLFSFFFLFFRKHSKTALTRTEKSVFEMQIAFEKNSFEITYSRIQSICNSICSLDILASIQTLCEIKMIFFVFECARLKPLFERRVLRSYFVIEVKQSSHRNEREKKEEREERLKKKMERRRKDCFVLLKSRTTQI